MSLAALARRLADAGTPMDAIIMALEAVEAEQAKAAEGRAKAAERKRRQRERDAGVTVTGQSQDTGVTAPFPAPPNENNLTPPTHTPVKQKPRARGAAIPDDWQPKQFGAGTAARAIVDGWPPGRIEREAEHFASHHRAKGTVSKDWHDSWSTWVHNSRRFRGSENEQRQHRNQSGSSSLDAMRRAIELTGGAEQGCSDAAGTGDWRVDALPDPVRAIGHVQR